MFQNPDKRFRKSLLAYGLILTGLYSLHINIGVYLLAISVFAFLCFFRRDSIIPYFVLSFPFINAVSSTLSLICLAITCFAFIIFLLKTKKGVIKFKHIALFALISIGGFISFCLGVKSEITSWGLLVLVVLMSFSVRSDIINGHLNYIVYAFDLCALCLILSIGIGLVYRRSDILLRGRLSFSDNVKTLAEFIVVPLYFRAIAALESKELFILTRKPKLKDRNVFRIIVYSFILILTISRGTIIAFAASLVVYAMFNHRDRRKFIFMLGLFFGATFGLLLFEDRLVRSGFLSNLSGFNGRTDVWNFYLNLYISRGNLLFGLGPGNVQRLAVGTRYVRYYIHSVIVDCIVTYGIYGITIMTACFFTFIKKAFAYKNPFIISLIALCLLMFFTHGSINYRLFYILIGIITGMLQLASERKFGVL